MNENVELEPRGDPTKLCLGSSCNPLPHPDPALTPAPPNQTQASHPPIPWLLISTNSLSRRLPPFSKMTSNLYMTIQTPTAHTITKSHKFFIFPSTFHPFITLSHDKERNKWIPHHNQNH
jgi:hypothetical protein